MKRKITLLGVAGISFATILFNTNTNLIANSGGSIGGYSSSVGDNGNSCGQGGCHGGGHIADASGYIVSDIPVTGYVPGSVYNIQLMGAGRGKSKFGFELAAENNLGATLGVLAPSGSGREQLKSNGQLTHTNSGNGTVSGGFGWQATWTAPAAGGGDVTFSSSVLFANGNVGNSGDSTRIASLTVSEDLTVSIAEVKSEIKALYPNPVINELTVSLENSGKSTISVINTSGKLIKKISTNNQKENIDFTNLDKGLYIISVEKNGVNYTKPVIKQ